MVFSYNYAVLEELLCEVLTDIQVHTEMEDAIVFTTERGKQYVMFHERNCCEQVYLADVNGALADLIGSPIVDVSKRTDTGVDDYGDKLVWTFYHISTNKGTVVLRWCGTTDRNYGLDVTFAHFIDPVYLN